MCFEWQSSQEQAFVKVNDILSVSFVHAFSKVSKPVVITFDVSKSGWEH